MAEKLYFHFSKTVRVIGVGQSMSCHMQDRNSLARWLMRAVVCYLLLRDMYNFYKWCKYILCFWVQVKYKIGLCHLAVHDTRAALSEVRPCLLSTVSYQIMNFALRYYGGSTVASHFYKN